MTATIPKPHEEGVTSSFISLIQEKQKFLLQNKSIELVFVCQDNA